MKKIGIFLLTLATVFTIAGCKKKDKKTKTTTVPGTTTGSNQNQYITPDVVGNLLENGNFNYGEVELASSGDQLIKTENGGEWWCYGMNGGYGQMVINEKHQLEVGIVMTSKEMHGIQLAFDGFSITKGSKYTFEFDAMASVARKFEIRIQQNGGSYENYLLEGKSGNIIDDLGTEMKHYKLEFTSAVTDIAPRMAINLGLFEGGTKYTSDDMIPIIDEEQGLIIGYKNNELVTFDNFVLLCTYDSGIEIDALDLASRPKITLNQVGFLPDQVKQAVFRGDLNSMDTSFKIMNTETNEYEDYNGKVNVKGTNTSSKEYVGVADFSDFTKPGKYKLVGAKCGESPVFEIGDDVYDQLFNDTIMMLYRQRCGEVLGTTEDKFAHAACHQTAYLYNGGTAIDVTGGWHDAGDYGKYVVPGAQTVADLLLTYQLMGDCFSYDSFVTNDASIPDILEEAMWELDWMLKMQASNGEVYHKVTPKDFNYKGLPTGDTDTYYVSPTSYAATADFAAVMAKASRILTKAGLLPDKAVEYGNAAEAAYNALKNMRAESFKNPSDIKTGEYPDSELTDEFAWASIEINAYNGSTEAYNNFINNYSISSDFGLGWANVNGFAIATFLEIADVSNEEYESILKILEDSAKELIANAKIDAYNVTIGEKKNIETLAMEYVFDWGSNLTVAANGMVLHLACLYSQDVELVAECDKYVQTQVNYLLGQNACAYCFVTGYGTLTPEHPHHRPSMAVGEAMKGMLVGGPDSNFKENGSDSVATRSCQGHAPAHCYIDNDNSWSTNEVTIYWNSPLTYLLAALKYRSI